MQVNDYVSSALASASSANGQEPAEPGVDGASVFAKAAGAPTPSYATAASTIACSAVANADTGTRLVIQEWLAYNSLVKLSNFLETIISTLLPSGNNALGLSSALATTFYTDPVPSTPWNTILGAIGPIFGILSAAFGGVGAAAGSAITGVISGILSETAGGQATVMKAMEDQRFTEAGDIEKLGDDWISGTYQTFTTEYTNLINKYAASSGWTSSDNGNSPVMANGAWLDFQEDDALHDNILDNVNKIMQMRMIK